ncbi:hypothetical protein N7528_005828 [Penicillium herquei]|nr:hypothetical protein N7528_005828 [Penicillium herquei]
MAEAAPNSLVPVGTDAAANAKLAEAWKQMENRVQQLASLSCGETYQKDLKPEDVMRNLDKIQNGKKKSAISQTVKETFSNTLTAVAKVGGMVADAASQVFAPAGQCYNALNFVISAWQGYQAVFGTLNDLFDKCGQFLNRLHHYVAGKMNAKLTDVACQVLTLFVDVCDHAMGLRHSKAFKFKTFMKIAFFDQDDFAGLMGQMDGLTKKESLLVLAQTYQKASEAAENSKNTLGLLSEDKADRAEAKKATTDRNTLLNFLNFENTPDTWDSTARAPITTWATTYQNIRQHKVEGTGKWLLEDSSFKAWTQPMTDTPILALVGEEAAGKSYLASTVINNLRTHVSEQVETSRRLVAFYYLDKKKANAGIDALGKSLIWQFAESDPSYMQSAAATCRRSGSIDPTRILPRLLLENHEELENVDVTFFIVINKLGDKDEHVHPAVVKFLQQTARCKRRAVRVLFTCKQGTINRLKQDDIICPTISIHPRNAGDVKKFIDARMDTIDSLSDTRIDGVLELRKEIQEKLYEKTNGNYYMIDKTLAKISALDYDKDIYKALNNANQSVEDHITDDVLKLNQSLNEKEIQEMNEIILWITFAQERMSVDIMTAVLRFKNDAASLRPLGERLKKKFLLFEIDNDGYVAFRSDKILSALPERAATTRDREKSNKDVNAGEVEILRHFLKSVCPPGLAEKLEMEQHFRSKLSNQQEQIFCEDKNTAHFQLAKVCLHALAGKAGENLRPLRGYASRQLMNHMSQVDLAEISSELKSQVGPDLVRVFRDQESIDNLLWATKPIPTFPPWFLEETQAKEIGRWLKNGSIAANLNEDERAWSEKLFEKAEGHQSHTLVRPAAHRMAEYCFKEESNVEVTMSAFRSLRYYWYKIGIFDKVQSQDTSAFMISSVEDLCRSESLALNQDATWETQMAIVYNGFSHASKAEVRCREALKVDKKYWRASLLLSQVTKSDTEAIETLKKLMKRFEADPSLMKSNQKEYAEMAFILGNRYWSIERLDKAVEKFSQCIDQDPANYSYTRDILGRYQDGQRWDNVIELLERLRANSHLTAMVVNLADETRFHVIVVHAVTATKKYSLLDQIYLDAIETAARNQNYNAAFYLRESYAGAIGVIPEFPLERITTLLEAAAKEDIPYTTLDATVAFFRVGYRLGRIYLDKAVEAKRVGNPELAVETLKKMSSVVPEQVNEDQMRLPLRLFSARYYKEQEDLVNARKMAHNTLKMAIELLQDDDESNDTLAYTKILYASIPFGDLKNVTAAVAMLKFSEGDQFLIQCSCKCEMGWTFPGDMWWCMDCINMVLTPQCYEKVKSGTFYNNVCHRNHQHLHVPNWDKEKMRKLPKGHVPWGEESLHVTDWKKYIIKNYIQLKK